jgi:hypothetical protein
MGHFPDVPESLRVMTFDMPGLRWNKPYAAGIAWASAVWYSANGAMYMPLQLSSYYNLKSMFLFIGATNTGNGDIGIYSADGTRLWSHGGAALGTANTLDIRTLGTPMLLPPGSYYIGVALSSASGTLFHRSNYGRAGMIRLAGIVSQATAYPLPATMTAAVSTQTKVPVCGIASITSY